MVESVQHKVSELAFGIFGKMVDTISASNSAPSRLREKVFLGETRVFAVSMLVIIYKGWDMDWR